MEVDTAVPTADTIRAKAQALQDVSNQEYNVDILCKAVDAYEGNVEVDLGIADDRFKKLKFNFTELETKQGLLRKLAEYDPAQVYGDADETTRMQLADETARKELKSGNEQRKAALQDITFAVSEAYEALDVQKRHASHLLGEVSALQETMDKTTAALAEQTRLYGEDPLARTADPAALEAELQAQTAACQAREQRIADLAARKAAMEQRVQALQTRKEQQTATLEQCQAQQASEHARLQSQLDWYDRAAELVSKLSGIRILSREEHSVTLALSTSGIPRQLSVRYSPATSRLEAASFGDEAANALIKGAVQEAVRRNDLPYLIREIKAKLGSA